MDRSLVQPLHKGRDGEFIENHHDGDGRGEQAGKLEQCRAEERFGMTVHPSQPMRPKNLRFVFSIGTGCGAAVSTTVSSCRTEATI